MLVAVLSTDEPDAGRPTRTLAQHRSGFTMRKTAPSPPQPLATPVDVLLADIAIRIQLSRTDYAKAVQRYEAVSHWIERPNSPLCDRVQTLYPQGSMATGSTIASKLRTDEFDIGHRRPARPPTRRRAPRRSGSTVRGRARRARLPVPQHGEATNALRDRGLQATTCISTLRRCGDDGEHPSARAISTTIDRRRRRSRAIGASPIRTASPSGFERTRRSISTSPRHTRADLLTTSAWR